MNVANAISGIAAGSSLTIKGAFNQTNGIGGGVIGSGLAALVPIDGALTLKNGQTTTVVSQVAPQSGQITRLAVGAGGSLTLAGAGTTLNVQDMFFSNAGTVSIGKGTALNLIVTGANLDIDSTLNQGIDLRVVDADTISTGEVLTVGGAFNIVFSQTGQSENALGVLQEVNGVLNLENGQTTTISPPTFAGPLLSVGNGGQINLSGGTTLTVNEPLQNQGLITTGSQGGNNTLTAGNFVNLGTLSLDGSGDQATFPGSFNNEGPATIGSGAKLTAGSLLNGSTIQVNPGGTLQVTSSFVDDTAVNLGVAGATGPQAVATLAVGGGSFGLSGPAPPASAGTVNLYNASDVITTAAPGGTLVNNDLTIQGTGNIGAGQMQIINNGNIFANATALETATNGTLLTVQPNGGGFTNNGGMQANAGNTLQIDVSDISFTGASGAFGFTNNNVLNAYGAVEITDRDPNTSVNLGNNGVINVGNSDSGTLQFNGENAQFNLFGDGNISIVPGSMITGVTGTETLVNEAGHTIIGSGSITDLNLTNQGFLIASQSGTPLVIVPADGTLVNSGSGLLDAINGATLSINGNVSNSATVSVAQGSTLVVSQGRTYTQTSGTTDVNGTLMAPAISINGGTLSSGGGIVETKTLTNGTVITTDSTGFIGAGSGPFTATNGYQQLANGTLDELISGASAFGTISVTGPASLDGTLDVALENGFIPAVGEEYTLLDFTPGGLAGTFATFLDQTFDNSLEKWGITYSNTDGDVFLTAQTNTTTTTPEPTSLLLFGTGLLGLALLRRRRRGAATLRKQSVSVVQRACSRSLQSRSFARPASARRRSPSQYPCRAYW